jgi:DNA-binding transcriptional LysR family regulator
MDFRLKVFIAVAKHLSFTQASKELHISQPAITKLSTKSIVAEKAYGTIKR